MRNKISITVEKDTLEKVKEIIKVLLPILSKN